MSEVWFAGDHHFGHTKILQFEPIRSKFATISEHDHFLVDSHNRLVGKRDIVYFLGDVCFHRSPDIFDAIMSEMNGIKILIKGNHDIFPKEVYARHFQDVHGVLFKYHFVMSHVPMHPYSLERWGTNVHGHTHSRVVQRIKKPGDGFSDSPFINDNRYKCVSLEQNNLLPIPLYKLRESLESK